jgi:5'-3' exonuclease
MNEKILAVDCNAIGYMSMFTMGELSYKEAKTGVIYGFLKSVLTYAKMFETNRFIFAWDSKKRYRQFVFPKYKMSRGKNLDEKALMKRRIAWEQFSILRKEVLPNMGFKNILFLDGYESDDLLAYFAKVNCKNNSRIILLTGDNDMFQCLNHCDIYHLYWKRILTAKRFEKDFGLPVSKWVDAKCLGGCNSDGVPGISGVSDPSKSKTSKAFLYLKGELKDGVVKSRIESEEGRKILRRNRILIKLPYSGFVPKGKKRISSIETHGKEKFRKKDFLDVFDQYRFISFVRDFKRWKEIFEL